MVERAKKFAVLTTGRAGSSSLLQTLEKLPGLITPANSTEVGQTELLNPTFRADFFSIYSGLCGRNLKSERELISEFYRQNQSARFVGFKGLYSQLSSFKSLLLMQDVTFVVLLRRDIASTIASFMVAMDRGCWGRKGNSHKSAWSFHPKRYHELNRLVVAHYVAISSLLRVPRSIVLHYEELCCEGFSDSRLESFFESKVRFLNPRPPVSGASYVANWIEFKSCVEECWAEACHHDQGFG